MSFPLVLSKYIGIGTLTSLAVTTISWVDIGVLLLLDKLGVGLVARLYSIDMLTYPNCNLIVRYSKYNIGFAGYSKYYILYTVIQTDTG